MENASTASVAWDDGAIAYLDQRLLPHEERYERARSVDDVVEVIATLAVRGAPAIGAFGAYGVALAKRLHPNPDIFATAVARIRAARPTAVNLMWAVDRASVADDPLEEAHAIAREQLIVDRAIVESASAMFPKNARVLTHCNTGGIATAGEGTALGAIIAAFKIGKIARVYVDETRPLLQGARLTTYELARAGVEHVLLPDAAAGIAMQRERIDLVIVGADRIARNGDTANKIGTYMLAIAAAHHGIPFYVAAPRSTFDFSLESGAGIPVEERASEEVTSFAGIRVAPEGTRAYNPAFDVTPGRLVTAFVTEYGVVRAPYDEAIPDLQTRPNLAALSRA
ncbi:MAG: S-methyl-5-thioribose-1-phosphate isomerase [Candidatus Eremiobacteraeota bacterium]|nr:S-methyl-5-thioribose-1-phosphate isomerase [Candidatus Eremiobacteraeota bacterium]